MEQDEATMLRECLILSYLSQSSSPLSFVILWHFAIFGWSSVSEENEGDKKQEGGSVPFWKFNSLWDIKYQACKGVQLP